MQTIRNWCFKNCRILTSKGFINNADCIVANGVVEAIGENLQCDFEVIEGNNNMLLPGLIDIHGDAFERHITPRAGVQFPLDVALSANDTSLVAAGITTFYYSITDGFEPGLRSRKTVRKILDQLEDLKSVLKCNTKIHIRHETVNTDYFDELQEWITSGRIDLISMNDHLPFPQDKVNTQRYLNGLMRREKMSEEEAANFIENLQMHRSEGLEQTQKLADLAAQCQIPVASHDDASESDVARAQSLNVSISEFPLTEKIARTQKQQGINILMGSPNLVRGGSHIGGISVMDALEADVVDILCSDYHYPSIFKAPFVIAEKKYKSFEDAWRMVSTNPAKAVGLENKGEIAVGKDADIILVRDKEGDSHGLLSDILVTMVEGRKVMDQNCL